jgi:alkenylglycerophosphocholine/alkenylglycerophosphoethanolamine hydrolase
MEISFLRVFSILIAVVYLYNRSLFGEFFIVAKSLPVLLLAIEIYRSATGYRGGERLGISIGLAICAGADYVIEYDFVFGLVLFLLAHVFYILTFYKIDSLMRLHLAIPVAVILFFVAKHIVAGAGDLALPVGIYCTTIGVMIWRAACVASGAGWKGRKMICLLGAALFGISDALIGWSKFVFPIQNRDFLVMSSYWAAQFMISASFDSYMIKLD